MKFLVDMPASPQLAEWLKEKGHDAVHASNIGLYKTKDRDVKEEKIADSIVVVDKTRIRRCPLPIER